MRQVCRKFARSLSVITFVVLASAAAAAQSQSRDLRLISARAGGVNYISGDASVRAEGKTDWRALDIKSNLEQGDAVRTGAASRVEVLLNPGSYLRVGEHTEFEMTDTSLEDLRLKLLRGSIIVEATGLEDMNPAITIETPQTEVSITRSGVYRLDVLRGGITEVVVVKGRAEIGRDRATVLKGGKMARISAGGVEVAKYDKKRRDVLDLWSKERGEELAEANRNLSGRTVRTLLASTRWDNLFDLNRGYGYGYGPAGAWVYNPARGCYTFISFYSGWRSPYGSYYDNSFNAPMGLFCRSCGVMPSVIANGGTPAQPGASPPPRHIPSDGGVRPPAPPRQFSPRPAERPSSREPARVGTVRVQDQ